MPKESAEEALKKIPLACKNLQISTDKLPLVANYIHNLVLTVLSDPALQERLHTDPAQLIKDLAKV